MIWRKCSSKQTRREFLATTIAPGIGYACLPSLATVIGNANALANGCASETAGTEFPAFIAIDLAGGASIAGNNVIVYKGDGTELLGSYEGLGLPNVLHPKETGKINDELGLKMHTDSRMLAGIKAVVAPEALANVNGCVICTQTDDDTSANELASAPGIFAAGGAGSIVPLVATQNGGAGSSGGRSTNAFVTSVAPTLITSPTSAEQLVSPGSYWNGERNRARLERVLRQIQNMSSAQLSRFAKLTTNQQVEAMANCGYQDAVRLMSSEGEGAETFNPFSNEFAGQQGTLQGQDPAVAAIGYLVLKGFAGSGTITLTGYDYHDRTIATGERQDERAGRAIGTLLEMARFLGRKLMIHVYTDGGVGVGARAEGTPGADGTDVEKFIWQTDTETHSAAFVLVYDPEGRPEMATQQLGAYRDAGGRNAVVNLTPARHAKIANSAHGQASVVVGNWLAWQTNDYATKFTAVNNKLRSGAVINNQELDDYLFVPKASG